MAGVVVQLALLGGQRPHAGERVQALEHLDGAEKPAARHPLGILAMAHLPVELRIVGRRGHLVEHPVDGRQVGHLAQPDAHHLGARDHHRGAVLFAREGDHFPVLPGDLLGGDAGDPADALVGIDDPIADVKRAVADHGLRGFLCHVDSSLSHAESRCKSRKS